jgi:hypothetical protein
MKPTALVVCFPHCPPPPPSRPGAVPSPLGAGVKLPAPQHSGRWVLCPKTYTRTGTKIPQTEGEPSTLGVLLAY